MATYQSVALESEKLKPKEAGQTTAVVDLGPDPGACFYVLAFFSFLLIVLFFPLSLLWSIKIVKEYERAVILRLGRLTSKKAKGPGLFFILPCVDDVRVVDLRIVTFDVPAQAILTKDSVTVRVDAVAYFRINNPTASIVNVESAHRSTYMYAQTTLRNVLGTKTLAEVLTDRQAISHEMSVRLDEATDPWGVRVERVEIKDVALPQEMQRSMAAEAEATREARAKVISAEGEQKASTKLQEAASVIDESPGALQLRFLQTLNTIAAENNHTYVFPLPVDLLMRLFGNRQ